MNNFAERSDCKRFRFCAAEDVTKNVRLVAAILAGLERRSGIISRG